MHKKPVKILVVGQTPPPYMGQAMMIDRLVKAKFDGIEIYHVRMSFSDSIKAIGRFNSKKVFHLFEIAWKVLTLRFSKGIDTLYYPPAGPNRTPIIRDIILLGIIRLFFKRVIYHFRAAGISDFLNEQPAFFRSLALKAYGSPEVSIQLSALNPPDGKYFNSGRVCIIPNGLEDAALPYLPLHRSDEGPVNILFVGVMREDKGVSVVIEAARLLKQTTSHFRVSLLGEFVVGEYEQEIRRKIRDYQLEEQVELAGVKTGSAKWQYYQQAHIFCFPSYFEAESFGNVVVEAMMFELPVVATLWRGIPDIVLDGETGYLVPIQSPEAAADKLGVLITDATLREQMGKIGRERYLNSYSLQRHLKAMEAALEIATADKAN